MSVRSIAIRPWYICLSGLLFALLWSVAGCQTTAAPAATVPPSTAAAVPPDSSPASLYLGYTHQRADGNRVVDGQGTLPEAAPLDIPLAGTPVWVTAVAIPDGVIWGVVLDSDFTQAFKVSGTQVEPLNIIPRVLVDTAPHLIYNPQLGEVSFATAPTNVPGGSHMVRLNAQSDHAFSTADGRLYVQDVGSQPLGDFSEVQVLPDGRLLVDENGRLLVLTQPTDRYNHGVLGDAIEAGGIALIEPRPVARLVTQIDVAAPQVIEGLAPLWVDWDRDEQREIIVTLSDAAQGAQIVVFDEAGVRRASGPAMGQGYRWRHQIAVAPFGPDGALELAAVRTPHLGGMVEFYRWEGDDLTIVAEVPGFTSHLLGSRNLDMGAAGDFDGDGRVELLLPTQDRTRLGAIYRSEDGADIAWTVGLDGRLTTNIGAATQPDGTLVVGVGTDGNLLRIWQP